MKTLSKSFLWHTCAVFRSRQHVDCPRTFWYKTSYALKFPRFSQSITSKTLKLRDSILFSKCCKFYVDPRNGIKLSRKYFSFWDRCFWIGCVILCYFVENSGHWEAILLDAVLRFEIWLKGAPLSMISIRMMKTLSKSLLWHTCAVFGCRQHVDFPRMFWYKTSYALKFPGYSQSITSKILKLRGSIFFSKFWKFDIDSENGIKLCWKCFDFIDKSLWISSAIFHYYVEKSGHWEAIPLDKVLRFEIWLKEASFSII